MSQQAKSNLRNPTTATHNQNLSYHQLLKPQPTSTAVQRGNNVNLRQNQLKNQQQQQLQQQQLYSHPPNANLTQYQRIINQANKSKSNSNKNNTNFIKQSSLSMDMRNNNSNRNTSILLSRQSVEYKKSKFRDMLNKTLVDMKVETNSKVISGPRNLEHASKLNNRGHIKRLMNSFIKEDTAAGFNQNYNANANGMMNTTLNNEVKYDKREFIPFVDERDQLGRLIQNEMQNYQQFNKPYVRRVLVFKPRKVQDKIEFSDEIPRRWKEAADSPVKNQEYYDNLEKEEILQLKKSFAPVISRNINNNNQNDDNYKIEDNTTTILSSNVNSKYRKQTTTIDQQQQQQNDDKDYGYVNTKTFNNNKKDMLQRRRSSINNNNMRTPKTAAVLNHNRAQSSKNKFHVTLFNNNYLDQLKYNTSFNSPLPMKSARNDNNKQTINNNTDAKQSSLVRTMESTNNYQFTNTNNTATNKHQQQYQINTINTNNGEAIDFISETEIDMLSDKQYQQQQSITTTTHKHININNNNYLEDQESQVVLQLKNYNNNNNDNNNSLYDYKHNIDTTVPHRKRRSQFRIKVFNKDQYLKSITTGANYQQSPSNNTVDISSGANNGSNGDENSRNLMDIIVKNYTKRSGTASFKSSIDRNQTNGLIQKPKAPPIGHYDFNPDQLHPRSKEVDLTKIPGRSQKMHPDQHLLYKQMLDTFDYSTFKSHNHNYSASDSQIGAASVVQSNLNGVDFGKIQPRDDVSFLKHLARFQMANKLGMDMQEFEQLWKKDKQGVYERLLMLRKS